MKNRRNVIIAFLLVAALGLGIGYAAVADVLTVDGKLSMNLASDSPLDETFDADVKFEAYNGADKVASAEIDAVALEGVTADVKTDDDDKFEIVVGAGVFTAVGQKVAVKVNVANLSDVQAVAIAIGAVSATGLEAFEITCSGADEIAANGTETYTITIELTQIPNGDIEEVPFTFEITAEPIVG